MSSNSSQPQSNCTVIVLRVIHPFGAVSVEEVTPVVNTAYSKQGCR